MRACSFLSKLAVEVVTEPKRQCFSLAREWSPALQASAVYSYVKPPTEFAETLLCLLSHMFLFSEDSNGMFALFVASSYVKVQNADKRAVWLSRDRGNRKYALIGPTKEPRRVFVIDSSRLVVAKVLKWQLQMQQNTAHSSKSVNVCQ